MGEVRVMERLVGGGNGTHHRLYIHSSEHHGPPTTILLNQNILVMFNLEFLNYFSCENQTCVVSQQIYIIRKQKERFFIIVARWPGGQVVS